jgi:transcriptional regulator with XRE-family HTH domain
MNDLGEAIKAWRDRVNPTVVGLPMGADRRTPGLRREELASLSGLSVDYVVRLEQGRAKNPSPQVLAALARALQLTTDERDMLYRTAGIAAPSDGVVSTALSPGLRRILEHLGSTPVGVFTAVWDFVLGNELWHSLFGDHFLKSGREANLVWRAFLGPELPLVQSPEQADRFAREMVSDLHAAKSVHPDDRGLAELICDLRRESPTFEHMWGEWHVANRISDRKTIDSPTVGPITFDCDVLSAPDSNLSLVVYTAPLGSIDAEKLESLKVAATKQRGH